MKTGKLIKKMSGSIWYYCAGRFIAPVIKCKKRKGQNTVEYLLMLASTSAVAVLFIAAFHKKILGGIFTIAGLIIGAGTPK